MQLGFSGDLFLIKKETEFFTTGSSEETLVAATGLIGQVFSDVHMRVHLVPYLLKGCIQVGLPVLLV